MARLLGTGTLSIHSAASPDASLRVTLTPARRGTLVRVLVEDLRSDRGEGAGSARLYAPPYRAEGLVEMPRVERLAADLQTMLDVGIVPAEFIDTDLVLQVALPLDDDPLQLELRETAGAPPLPMALRLIQDFALEIVSLPETRMERLPSADAAPRRSRALLARLLVIALLVGAGGYLVGGYFERGLAALGCAP